jgi:hypothetical protein
VLNPERIAGCYLLSTFRILADEIFAILSRQQPFFSGQSEGVNPKSLSKTQKYYFLFKLHFNFPFVFLQHVASRPPMSIYNAILQLFYNPILYWNCVVRHGDP